MTHEKALEAAIRAHDKEYAAQKGEPAPWANGFPEPFRSERMYCAKVFADTYFSTLTGEHGKLVERLSPHIGIGGCPAMTNDADGEYVHFEALTAQAATIAAQAAEIERVRAELGSAKHSAAVATIGHDQLNRLIRITDIQGYVGMHLDAKVEGIVAELLAARALSTKDADNG